MRYPRIGNLRNLFGDVRGASMVSYAVLLGGLTVLAVYGVRSVSGVLTTSLTNQASDLQAIAGGDNSGGGSTAGSSGSSGSSGSGGSTAGSGGSSGSSGSSGSGSSGSSGSGKGKGKGKGKN